MRTHLFLPALLALAIPAASLVARADPSGHDMPDDGTTFDHDLVIGTDGAEIVLSNPLRLLDHRHDPVGWSRKERVTREDRRNGHLLHFDTGGDGGYGVRVTDGPLRPREREHVAGSIVLRLRVGESGVLLDGGYAWPHEDSPEVDDSQGRLLDIPPGDYAATITSIARPHDGSGRYLDVASPDGPMVDYVVRLDAVEDLETVPMMEAVPLLYPGEPPSTRTFEPMTWFGEPCEDVPSVALLLPTGADALPAPGTGWTDVAPAGLHEHVHGTGGAGTGFPDEPGADAIDGSFGFGFRELHVVLAPNDVPGTVGRLAGASGWSVSYRDGERAAEMFGGVSCAVRILGRADPPDADAALASSFAFVAIESLRPLASNDGGAASDALVASYAAWLRRSGRRDLRYRLAEIEETTEPRHRFSLVSTKVEPPAERLSDWIVREGAVRDRALSAWIDGQH